MRSSSAVEARPVRTLLNSVRVCSIDPSIRRWQSARKSSIAATAHLPFAVVVTIVARSRDDGADPLTRGDAHDVPVRELEHVDRNAVVHAQRERRRVHHPEAALDRLEVRQLGQELRVGVGPRVAVVDAR